MRTQNTQIINEQKKNQVTISIITPMYDGDFYVKRLISMAEANQAYCKLKESCTLIELVLIDDFPDSNVGDWITQYGGEITVKYQKNEDNRGIHWSRIHGLSMSSGDYILFLDQDDIISDHYIYYQLRNIGSYDVSVSDGYDYGRALTDILISAQQYMETDFYQFSVRIFPGQCLIKRTAMPMEWTRHIVKNNCADDVYLFMLMRLSGVQFTFVKERLYNHLSTGRNASAIFENLLKSTEEVFLFLVEDGLINYESKNAWYEGLRADLLNYSQNIRDKKYQRISQLLDLWLSIKEVEGNISDYFLKMGFNVITIYGVGILGRHLLNELDGSEIEIESMMDRKVNEYNGKKCIRLGDQLKKTNAIVTTQVGDIRDIISELKKCYKIPIVSIEEVLTSMIGLD